MFEIGVISIVVLAVGYWVTLWLMGRHDDVLHGDFVHDEDGARTSAALGQYFPSRSPFPAKPVFPAKPTLTKPSTTVPSTAKLSVIKPAPALPAQPSAPVPAAALSERSDTLQTLLASIKRDLKDASQL